MLQNGVVIGMTQSTIRRAKGSIPKVCVMVANVLYEGDTGGVIRNNAGPPTAKVANQFIKTTPLDFASFSKWISSDFFSRAKVLNAVKGNQWPTFDSRPIIFCNCR